MGVTAVIGAGASGLMAALTAAEQSGNRVILFERQQRLGRKLMATGNGRCNLTNDLAAELTAFHSLEGSPLFVAPAMQAFDPDDVRSFFASIGLITVNDRGISPHRVYPLSDSANSVVDVLRYAVEHAGVELRTAETIGSITRSGAGFRLKSAVGTTTADKVIIACGGIAGGKLGGVKDGYELLQSLGHSRTKLFPALVPLSCDSPYPRSLKGVRAEAGVSFYSLGADAAVSEGEVQFTDNGVSGPAVFEISRQASVSAGGRVVLDFLNRCDREQARELLRTRIQTMPELPCGELLTGVLHNRLGRMVIKYAGLDMNMECRALTEKDIDSIIHACSCFELKCTGTGSFDNAQVTVGGIRTCEFVPETLESRIVPGLYACGEVLDIDADCGGFNLQWAWASGRLAGQLKHI